MPILGLGLIFLWLAILLATTVLLRKKAGVPTFYTRKILHIGTSLVWVIGKLCIGATWHMFIPNTLSLLAIAVSFFFKPMDGIEEQPKTGEKRNYGTLYFAISTMALTSCNLFPTLYPLAGLAFCALAFGDGLAAICGKLAKKRNPALCKGKTLVGMVCCFAISTLVAFVFNVWLKLSFTPLAIFAIGGLTALLELYTPFGLDNFTIPIGVLSLGYAITTGSVSDALLFVCAVSPLLAILTLLFKVFTPRAACMAFVMLIAFAMVSKYVWIINIFVGYAIIVLAKLIKKIVLTKRDEENQKRLADEKHGRSSKQLFTNLGFPLWLATMFYFTDCIPLAVGAFSAFGCSIADSIASDIGVLQRAKPFDVCRWKRVDAGVSGGISLLGSLMALLIGAVNVAFCLWVVQMSWQHALVVGLCALVGVLIDSVLGSLLQAKYKCEICGTQTETPLCCNEKPRLTSGVAIVDNNMVNVLANGLSALLGVAFALIVV